MKQSNLIAVDLAKHVFQVCVLDANGEQSMNKEMRRDAFTRWLAKQPPSDFAVEACASAHYWAKKAISFGHNAQLIDTRFVRAFRQGHKTDKNDALAIAIAAKQPKRSAIQIKNDEQLWFQGCGRIREHYQDEKRATSNLLRSLLNEFGLIISQGDKALRISIPEFLEDAENGLPVEYRKDINQMYQYWCEMDEKVKTSTARMEQLAKHNPICKKLMQLEGVGSINAVGLYLLLGVNGDTFKNGRAASACIGVVPTQHSSGGKTVLAGISKGTGNKRLRSQLIQGALSVVNVVQHREVKNSKEQWLKSVIERRGLRRAAVALVNKTIRTAWAMIRYEQDYRLPQ